MKKTVTKSLVLLSLMSLLGACNQGAATLVIGSAKSASQQTDTQQQDSGSNQDESASQDESQPEVVPPATKAQALAAIDASHTQALEKVSSKLGFSLEMISSSSLSGFGAGSFGGSTAASEEEEEPTGNNGYGGAGQTADNMLQAIDRNAANLASCSGADKNTAREDAIQGVHDLKSLNATMLPGSVQVLLQSNIKVLEKLASKL
jgi:glucose/arabinose dehydrogenase